MKVDVLGPLQVRTDDGTPVDVSGARLSALVVRLAIDAGRPVGTAALAAAVWAESPPADVANALQTLVSRFRRAAGDAGAVVQAGAGYKLSVQPEDVDTCRFERLAADGTTALRAGDPQRASDLLQQALTLWRGELPDDAGDDVRAIAVRLAEQRRAANLDRLEAALLLGRAAQVVSELEAESGAHSTDERVAGLLMRALATAGRQTDALMAYERVRARLADDLGVDPSPALQQVHLAILRGELSAGDATSAASRDRRHNLRSAFTSFVGRETELSDVGGALMRYRLVTLVGPGGSGKTRLASEAASALVAADSEVTADGAWMVELAGVMDSADIPLAVLGALGMRVAAMLDHEQPVLSRDASGRVIDALVDKRALVVLDNCEHVIDAAARFAEAVLMACPQLRILATSREPLAITGELLTAVAPLKLPDVDVAPEQAMQFPAIRLLADRAAAAVPGFEINATTLAAAVEIVRRLDGLPLAIELAAARLRTMPIAELADRLGDRFRLLTGGSRTAMPRHRTLRAVVEWSWELLTADERMLAERFSVFPSGAIPRSVGIVCTDDLDPDAVGDRLNSLADKSLLQVLPGGRFRMLETIREYGADRLSERGELHGMRDRHARHFTEVMVESVPHIITGEQLEWMRRTRDERDNILAALRFWCDTEAADRAMELAVAMSSLAMLLGNHSDVADWIAAALATPGWTDRPLRAAGEALYALNSANANVVTDTDIHSTERLRRINDDLADIDMARYPMAAMLRPVMAMFCHDTELAERLILDGLASDNPWVVASTLMFRANLRDNEGDVDGLRADVDAALTAFRALGERWGLASTLRTAAVVATVDGRLDDAERNYAEAFDLMAEIESHEDQVFILGRMADLAARQGDMTRAAELADETLLLAESNGSAMEAVFAISTMMEVARFTGDTSRLQQLYEAASNNYRTVSPDHPAKHHLDSLHESNGILLALSRNDTETAMRHAVAAYRAALETRDFPIVSYVGIAIAHVAKTVGRPLDAASILAASAVVRGAEDPTSPGVSALRSELIAELGETSFQAGYDEGRAMDRDTAIARLNPSTFGG